MRIPAKDVRRGDWIEVGGVERRVTACFDRPPHKSESGCFMRSDNVWLGLGKREVVAILRDEPVHVRRKLDAPAR